MEQQNLSTMEQIKQIQNILANFQTILENHSNGMASSMDVVMAYQELQYATHADTKSIYDAIEMSMEPLANYIQYMFSEENIACNDIQNFLTNEANNNPKLFEANCELTKWRLGINKVNEEEVKQVMGK